MTTSLLLIGGFLGSLGAGYCVYGRRQQKPLAFLAGVLLMLFPTFISNLPLLIGVAILVAALPFLAR